MKAALMRMLPFAALILACALFAVLVAALSAERGRDVAPIPPEIVECREPRGADPRPAQGSVDEFARDDGAALPGRRVPLALEAVRISGWLYAGPGDTAVPCILIDGRVARDQLVTTGKSRPDVAAVVHDANAVRTGYIARVSTEGLGLGAHRVQVAALGPDGAYRTAPGAATLTIVR